MARDEVSGPSGSFPAGATEPATSAPTPSDTRLRAPSRRPRTPRRGSLTVASRSPSRNGPRPRPASDHVRGVRRTVADAPHPEAAQPRPLPQAARRADPARRSATCPQAHHRRSRRDWYDRLGPPHRLERTPTGCCAPSSERPSTTTPDPHNPCHIRGAGNAKRATRSSPPPCGAGGDRSRPCPSATG